MSNQFIPNSFQLPNSVVDDLIRDLTGSELKCYLVIVRKTKGWNKEYDAISISQLMEVTGLSNRAVIDACNRLTEIGLLTRQKGARGVNVFTPNLCKKFTSEESSPVKKVHSACEESSQDPVKKVHTQNNNKNTPIKPIKKTSQKKSQSAVEILASFGVEGELAEDFIQHRKAKRAVITNTVMARLKKQADLAKLPLGEVVAMMIERGWQGFQADWDWKSSDSKKPKFSDDDDSWWRGKTIEIRGY
ncbi:replication protein [Avibacterium paragallinarum]|uniref:replication protein n=1 Tax=Avibacterium paragallinarum TaxID=728 RepID=UPI002ED83BCE